MYTTNCIVAKPGFKGAQWARTPGLPPTEGLPPKRSFYFFLFIFHLMIDAYETTT